MRALTTKRFNALYGTFPFRSKGDVLTYSVASFFSGIGGLDLGLERAGFRINFHCEVKPFCREILSQHWPDLPIDSDIRKLDDAKIPKADVWAAGFPCQDLSLARMGPRSGLRGSQSGLFHEFMRLVRGRTPRAIILENVHGLLSSHGGRDFAIVLQALDELGYGVAWRVLNSKDFGVPQQRRRVYIVAMHRDERSPGQVLFEPECGDWNFAKGRQDEKKSASLFQTIIGDPSKGPLVKSVAHCIYAESARHTGTDWSRNYVWYPEGRVRRFTPNEVERVQGFPDDWTRPRDFNEKQADKIDSLRYHAVGNAVTPPVAQWVGERLMKVMREQEQTVLRSSLVAAE
ncbi:DNA (cytosine-5-)-methyltransferase [Ensifer sp. PDNC004]|uniref:DNA cytosine methyltransferase n=1 Tax=Ensifer sp. PDNC004 TaxID=2811423 RepID=UPI00196281CA|nr:DNA (cytosine-5-)-methyltransferase [Ensifer sp. PDNC004]QRY67963.1 DNA (cytosine-5-)-methyltransferase [Ensifer sp. PDNC004]